MADFILGRLKFTYLGNWVTGTSYIKDDIIKYGGRTYVCIGNHTANANFYTDSARWSLMVDGTDWKGAWHTETYYKVNDIVQYDGMVYVCNLAHTSSNDTIYDHFNKWTLYVSGTYNRGVWAGETQYNLNDIIAYGGQTYICINEHVSASNTIYGNFGDWQLYTSGFFYRGEWTPSTQYNLNDVVRYGSDSYIVVTQHISGAKWVLNEDKFDLFAGGVEFVDSYSPSVDYAIGDIVTFGGYSYIASNESIGIYPNANSGTWEILTTGFKPVGTYNENTKYEPGDVVNYGAYTYVNTLESRGNLPSNPTYWSLVSKGLQYLGLYDSGTGYVKGDVVRFGGNNYIALTETTGINPTTTNTSQWLTLTTGVNYSGYYNVLGTTQYNAGDIVAFGGNTYISKVTSTGIQPTPANSTQWSVFTQGYRPQGYWNSGSTYQQGDTVLYANNTFVSITTNNINQTPTDNPTNWTVLAQGSMEGVMTTKGDIVFQSDAGIARLPVGANGQVLVVGPTGLPQWEDSSQSANVYYVCADTGIDDPQHGHSLQRPWKTIQYASQRLDSANSPNELTATIMLKAGTYKEQLPITLPPGCSIVGDSTRTTIVEPAAGNDLSGSIPNANSTMFLLSDSTMLTHFTMKGMTGYAANNAVTPDTTYTPGSDISTHTIAGVFLRLNPDSPITVKSPYINDMTAISSGGIGVVVDGSVHATGAKSMLFHSFTNINDDGVGFYVTQGGRIEAVSCFTYFCHFGYVADKGGIIRALNGNNSYGKFGSVSTGFNPSESPITANVYGSMIGYQANSIASGVVMTSNNYIKGTSSESIAKILSFQTSSSEIYIKKIYGEGFITNEEITEYTDEACTEATGVTALTQTTSPEAGQSGFIVTLNDISANTVLLPGSSIQFTAGPGNQGYDPYAYVIASVSTWSNEPNTAIVTLTSTKPNSHPSYDGQSVRIRQQFSNIRLTGHDFLAIGTGGIAATNYPNTSITQYIPGNQVISNYPGRVYYVTTDQSGNFTVGQYFSVNQATGAATLNASSFNLSGLSSLRLGSIGAQLGAQINEFSTDTTMSQDSNQKVPTQAAIKAYVDNLVKPGGTATGTGVVVLNDSPEITDGVFSGTQVMDSINVASGTFGTLSAAVFYSGEEVIQVSGELAHMTGDSNTYQQVIIQNANNGTQASVDFVVTNDIGTDDSFYGDFGINSSTFAGTGRLDAANAVYLYADADRLVIGTENEAPINFVVNGGETDALTIHANNKVSLYEGVLVSGFNNDKTLSANSANQVPTQYAVKGYVDDMHAATFEPTGFNRGVASSMGIMEFSLDGNIVHKIDENSNYTVRSDSKFATGTAWEDSASPNTFVIYPASGQTSFTVWQAGIKYTFSDIQKRSISGQMGGAYYFFIDQGQLVHYTSMSGDYIQKEAFCGLVYVNEFTSEVLLFADERHGITMDGATHYYLHTTTGTRFKSGLGVAGVAAGIKTFTSLASGELWDEDILIPIPSATAIPMLYRNNTRWSKYAADTQFAKTVANVAQYNPMFSPGVYTVEDIPAGEYAVMYIMATNDRINPLVRVMGQYTFTTLAEARESAQTEPRDTVTTGLPVTEFLWVGAVVVDHLGYVQTLDTGAVYVDLRYVNISSGTNSSSAVQATASDTYFDDSITQLGAQDAQYAIESVWNIATKAKQFAFFTSAI